jgi:hypothetical protein
MRGRGQCGATVSQPAAVPGCSFAGSLKSTFTTLPVMGCVLSDPAVPVNGRFAAATFRRANRRTTYLPLIARMRRRAGRRGGPGRRSGAPRVRWGVRPATLAGLGHGTSGDRFRTRNFTAAARLAVAGAPGAGVGHDAGLGVAVERHSTAGAEDLLAAAETGPHAFLSSP